MKRFFVLPIMAIGFMVSQAWAASAECTSDNKTFNYVCNWGVGGCWKLDADPALSETCASRAKSCSTTSNTLLQIYATDLATLTQGSNGYDCTNAKFYTVSYDILTFDDLEDVGEGPCMNGGTKQVFCQQTWGCMALDTRYSEIGEGATATCSPTGTRCTCPQLIADCPTLYTDVNKTKMPNNGNGAQCSAYGGVFAGGIQPPSSSSVGNTPSSSSGGNPDPIISYNKAPVMGLKVISFASSLQIASGKDATVALFDMHGKQIFSQKVLSGTTTISLEKQRQGVYYAVVRSGAQKQTLKVVLK